MRPAEPHILAVAMFLGTVAWSFVYVSLPFHIREMSLLDPMVAGWILGIPHLATVVVAPFWGPFADRLNAARIGAAFVGPVIATTILAWTSPLLLYLVLAAIGVACVPLVGLAREAATA